MNNDEAIAFLRSHQPMPDDVDLSGPLIEEYDEVRRYLESNPDPRAPELLLRSLGRGSGFGVYQLVADTIRVHDRELVIEALQQVLSDETSPSMDWAVEIAGEYLDERLDELILGILVSGPPGQRYFAAAYLADRGEPVPGAVIARALEGDIDDELTRMISEIRTSD